MEDDNNKVLLWTGSGHLGEGVNGEYPSLLELLREEYGYEDNSIFIDVIEEEENQFNNNILPVNYAKQMLYQVIIQLVYKIRDSWLIPLR